MLDHPMILFDFETARDRSLEERSPERDGLWTLMREAMYLSEENLNMFNGSWKVGLFVLMKGLCTHVCKGLCKVFYTSFKQQYQIQQSSPRKYNSQLSDKKDFQTKNHKGN